MAVSPELAPQILGQVVDLPDYEQEVPLDFDARVHIHELCDDLDLPDPAKSPSSPQASAPGDDWIVDMVASMEATRPEIIRGVPVHCALRGCGQAMRGKQRGLYKFSCATTEIDEFWSHSWHTSAWMKFVTAWYLNSGVIAVAFGMVGAVLGCVLHAVEGLPATVDNGFCKSQWSVLIGLTFYCLSFMFWRVRKLVFLDFLCINQEDDGLKGEAMISMGAILKSSASMLVLWDPSWVQRLGFFSVGRRDVDCFGFLLCNTQAPSLTFIKGRKPAQEILVRVRASILSTQPAERSYDKPASEYSTKPYGTGFADRKGWPDCLTCRMAELNASVRG